MEDDDWLNAATADDIEEETAAEVSEAIAESVGPAAVVAAEPEPLKPSKPQREKAEPLVFNRHWIRPKFLQYSYLYNYRHNYYDDVIDYLDRRQKGITRDLPRAQTWAERALRTYVKLGRRSYYDDRHSNNIKLVEEMKGGARFYNYHSKDYISLKYSKLLL